MTKLMKTANGRMVAHTIVLVNNIIHFRKPNVKFYAAAVKRYLNGIG